MRVFRYESLAASDRLQLYPLTAEFYRLACEPNPIIFETSNLIGLWQCDTTPRPLVRKQLLQILDYKTHSSRTHNNLLTICTNSLLWQETASQCLPLLNRLELKLDHGDTRSTMNYVGFHAKALAECGDFSQALNRAELAAQLITDKCHSIDIWVLLTRTTIVCRRAGKMQDALFFSELSAYIATKINLALPLSRSKYGLAYQLVGEGNMHRANTILTPLIDGVISNREWVESGNLPILPMLLASCKIHTNEIKNARRLIDMSIEMEQRGMEQYFDSFRAFTITELLLQKNDTHAALDPWHLAADWLLEMRDIDLFAVNRALRLQGRLNTHTSPAKLNMLKDISLSYKPNAELWQQNIAKFKYKILQWPDFKAFRPTKAT